MGVLQDRRTGIQERSVLPEEKWRIHKRDKTRQSVVVLATEPLRRRAFGQNTATKPD